MESGRGSGGGPRSGHGGKKMRKRKELDALVGGGGKRCGGGSGGRKRAGSGGVSPQDQLLSESTADEDYWVSKGLKPRRRYVTDPGSRPCGALLRVCTVLLVMACLVATLTVMWLFIDIREQTTYLHNQLDQVAAGSQGVPDALQKCHSLSRQLQNNQTVLFTQLSSLSQHLNTFTNQVSGLKVGLAKVEEKLTSSPELVNVPHDLQSLSASVASIGSQIQDLQTTSNHLKEEHNTLLETIKALQKNASALNKAVGELMKVSHEDNDTNSKPGINDVEKKLDTWINKIKLNFTTLNETLSRRLQWVLDDQHKDHKLIEALQEMSANVSSRLTTLQNECSAQVSKIEVLSSSVNDISKKVAECNKHWEDATKHMNFLTEKCKKLDNSTSNLTSELSALKMAILPDSILHEGSYIPTNFTYDSTSGN